VVVVVNKRAAQTEALRRCARKKRRTRMSVRLGAARAPPVPPPPPPIDFTLRMEAGAPIGMPWPGQTDESKKLNDLATAVDDASKLDERLKNLRRASDALENIVKRLALLDYASSRAMGKNKSDVDQLKQLVYNAKLAGGLFFDGNGLLTSEEQAKLLAAMRSLAAFDATKMAMEDELLTNRSKRLAFIKTLQAPNVTYAGLEYDSSLEAVEKLTIPNSDTLNATVASFVNAVLTVRKLSATLGARKTTYEALATKCENMVQAAQREDTPIDVTSLGIDLKRFNVAQLVLKSLKALSEISKLARKAPLEALSKTNHDKYQVLFRTYGKLLTA
jgi:hypothetical protein